MQTKTESFIEAIANIAVGFIVSLVSQIIIFHFYGIGLPLHDNIMITIYFTFISLVRSYVLRRYFNGLKFKKASV
jgi:hypothetical protein